MNYFPSATTAVLLVLWSGTAVFAQSDEPAWRAAKIGAMHIEDSALHEVADALSDASGTPIHLIYPLKMNNLSLKLESGATLGDAVDVLKKTVKGLSVSTTGRGIVLACPLPEEAISPMNRIVENIDFRGSLDQFINKYVVPTEWTYFPGTGTKKFMIRASCKKEIKVRDLLAKVAESNGIRFRIGIAPEAHPIVYAYYPDFNFSGKPESVTKTKPTRAIGFSFSWDIANSE